MWSTSFNTFTQHFRGEREQLDNMKTFLFQVFLFGSLVVMAYSAATQRPAVSDDAIDTTLNDKRYVGRLLKCALGEVPCDPVGRRLKSLAPLVLRGACTQCTPQEKRQIQKVLAYVQKNYPKEWNKILQQYAG